MNNRIIWHFFHMALVCAFLAACGPSSTKSTVVLSKASAVCMDIPTGASYKIVTEGVDYDVGTLSYSGKEINVYVGRQPPYEGDTWPANNEDTLNRFSEVGRGTWDGVEKILLARKPDKRRGAFYVMFYGAKVHDWEEVIGKPSFVKECAN